MGLAFKKKIKTSLNPNFNPKITQGYYSMLFLIHTDFTYYLSYAQWCHEACRDLGQQRAAKCLYAIVGGFGTGT